MHDVTLGEQLNIGIIFWAPDGKTLRCQINDKYGRLSKVYPGFDGTGYRSVTKHLRDRINAAATSLANPQRIIVFQDSTDVAPTTLASILNDVLREDASCLQHSRVRGGVTEDIEAAFERLVQEYLIGFDPTHRERRDEDEVWETVQSEILKLGEQRSQLRENVRLEGPHYDYAFKLGWQNGVPQVLEPISFDLTRQRAIVDKATTWSGRLANLQGDFQMSAVIARPRHAALKTAFEDAIAILEDAPHVRAVVAEESFEDFVPEIERDLQHAAG